MKGKILAFFTVAIALCAVVFSLYNKYIRVTEYPVFLESFGNGILTVDSTQTVGEDGKYKVNWAKDEVITININPERTADAYYNLEKLEVNGVDVTKDVSMLQYRTPVTEKLTVLASFKKGKAPSSTKKNEIKGTAKQPEISKYFDNPYVGAYAAYDIEDPTVFYDEASGYYYCFGSDNTVIKSKDLVNWSGRTTYFKTPENANTNAIMDFTQFASVKKWAEAHGYDNVYLASDSNSDRTPLAPDVVKVGSVYYLYFSLSKQAGANESAIFVVKTNNIARSISEKRWIDAGMIICSCGRHAGTQKLIDENGNKTEATLNAQYDEVNAVHPSVFYDGNSMYMVYGSYFGNERISGGIYMLELDPKTGLVKESSSVSSAGTAIGTLHGSSSRPAGTLVAAPGKIPALSGGSSNLAGAPDLVYNKDTGYYYLFVTYGVDDTNYNIRVARSTNAAGPYTDFAGESMIQGGNNQYDKGYMLIGGYNFTSSSKGSVAYTDTGRASVGSPAIIKVSNGAWFMAAQSQLYYKVDSRIVTGSVIAEQEEIVVNSEPCLEIREILWDDTGWPVVMPEIFTGVRASKKISSKDMYGIWDVLVFDRSADKEDYRAVARTVSERLTVYSGAIISASDIAGNKELNTSGVLKKEGDYYKMTVDGIEYKIYPRFMWDWELEKGSLVFTGLGADGSTIWGKRSVSSTAGMYTDAFYYLYDKCDDATKADIDKKVKKIKSNPTQDYIDTLSKSIIKSLTEQAAEG